MSAATEATETPAIDPHSITFTGEIKALATKLGRSVPPAEIADINLTLQSLGRINQAGKIEVQAGDETLPLGTYIAGELARFPFAAPEADKTVTGSAASDFVQIKVGNYTSWRRRDDAMVSITQGFEAARAAETAKAIATWPNPWAKGSENRTRQAVISNTNPALAAKFKAQASA